MSFICSSNNNIPRISQMVASLCLHYGPLIGHVGGEAYHDFPEPNAFTGNGVEADLRRLGFGYRAKYIHQTALMVAERGLGWLEGLRNPGGEEELMPQGGREGYRLAHAELLALQGVGPKVADCVALMGLGWSEAVPVDTHGQFHYTDERKYANNSGHSMANRSARLQIRQGQTQQSDESDVRRSGQQVSLVMGKRGWVGAFGVVHRGSESVLPAASREG